MTKTPNVQPARPEIAPALVVYLLFVLTLALWPSQTPDEQPGLRGIVAMAVQD